MDKNVGRSSEIKLSGVRALVFRKISICLDCFLLVSFALDFMHTYYCIVLIIKTYLREG